VAANPAGGPGSDWAATAPTGQRLRIGLPHNHLRLVPQAPYHLFLGEETGAVPLLSMLLALAPTVPTFGVLETTGPASELPIPAGSGVSWVHRGRASAVNSPVLLRALAGLDLPAGPGVAYLAGEAATCRAALRHLLRDRGWPRGAIAVQTQWAADRTGMSVPR
jgi:NADPH-dependent ferric siderophore reductase